MAVKAKAKAKGKPKSSRVPGRKVAKPRARKQLTRKDLCKLMDTGETHEAVRRALTNAKGSSVLKDKLNLSRASIVVAEKVFQWRLLGTDVANREEHIVTMANAIVDSNKPLDAILVFPVGDKFYVVDGHHRLAAYHTARWIGPIPATVFSGTLDEAYLEALRLNSRNKLPMTKDDKQEAAWRLVKFGGTLSREKISELTTASTSNISNMKRVLKKLQGLERSPDAIPIADLTWGRARREDWELEEGGKNWDADGWKERKANEIVEALMRANIGFMLKEHPDVTAMALERLDENLPEALMAEWLYRPENEDFLVGFIEDHLDEEAAKAWKASLEPMRF